jgi:hypothetical protein
MGFASLSFFPLSSTLFMSIFLRYRVIEVNQSHHVLLISLTFLLIVKIGWKRKILPKTRRKKNEKKNNYYYYISWLKRYV